MSKPISYRLIQFLCCIPILLWPLSTFMSLFVFDDPSANETLQWIVFIVLNGYPMLCILALVISNKIYDKDRETAVFVLAVPFLLYAAGLVFLFH